MEKSERLRALHKVGLRHARGEGVREGVTVCDRGRGGPRASDVKLLKFFIHIKPKIESHVKLSVVTDVF